MRQVSGYKGTSCQVQRSIGVFEDFGSHRRQIKLHILLTYDIQEMAQMGADALTSK